MPTIARENGRYINGRASCHARVPKPFDAIPTLTELVVAFLWAPSVQSARIFIESAVCRAT